MKNKFFSFHLDFLGFSASVLCAVHCMAIPVVMAVGAFSGLAWISNPWMEAGFIGLSFGIASWSLLQSYFQHHRQYLPLRIVAVGFALLLLSRFTGQAWEPFLAALGGIAVAGAHWANWRLCSICKTSS